MLPDSGSILRGVDFWEVLFVLVLSSGWIVLFNCLDPYHTSRDCARVAAECQGQRSPLGLSPASQHNESQDHNLVLTVFDIPGSLDSGLVNACL